MTDYITRIQDWYKVNCDGHWEHSYGYSISTLDNPGWMIRIDLSDTPLENLEYDKEYQNPEMEHDWYFLRTKEQALDISCGPENLLKVLQIFFDEIIPNLADKEFSYTLHVPLKGHHFDIWTPVSARMINEKRLEVVRIDPVVYRAIKVRDIGQIDFDEEGFRALQSELIIEINEGDVIEVELTDVADGIIITPKNQNISR